ncbi:thiamine biosynthesis protein ThiS [Melioribacter roseus P3M-2]|uniref:Thiamine biosynthesis protein ThiS n=1 Tax=Melioribacter roseus (strain DSM 23840 / JCM 17771 / VKM B-2668 / P3M-2) TaxID=1191523 RepID=I7A2G0_MELRP|nr:sulfur carrier protein ThiS [Melioribacter roseus]AFN74111.1 thiamine biosynthesis protein ThiS [Melioribacter roseus P3M-2]
MNLTINGNNENIEKDKLTVSELLKLKDVEMPEMVSVELNGEILDRDKYDTTELKDSDVIEFLYFMGGGGN